MSRVVRGIAMEELNADRPLFQRLIGTDEKAHSRRGSAAGSGRVGCHGVPGCPKRESQLLQHVAIYLELQIPGLHYERLTGSAVLLGVSLSQNVTATRKLDGTFFLFSSTYDEARNPAEQAQAGFLAPPGGFSYPLCIPLGHGRIPEYLLFSVTYRDRYESRLLVALPAELDPGYRANSQIVWLVIERSSAVPKRPRRRLVRSLSARTDTPFHLGVEKMQKLTVRALVTILAGISCLSPAIGQETRSTIFGRVTDPQGSAVVGATVVVTNVQTNVTTARRTNESGYYEADLLLPGNYSIAAEAPGFKKSLQSGVVLSLSTRIEITMSLQLGAATETVQVTAEAPLVDPSSSVSAGRVMDTRDVVDLPIFNNSPLMLIKIAPGVQSSNNRRYNGVNALGGTSDAHALGGFANDWSIDGVPDMGNGFPRVSPTCRTRRRYRSTRWKPKISMPVSDIPPACRLPP